MTVVDLFAGMGGWDHAARQLGIDPLGVEHNPDACATREAAGLRTLQADIAELDPADFAPCEGLIASPPCQAFSVAGKGGGRVTAFLESLAGTFDREATLADIERQKATRMEWGLKREELISSMPDSWFSEWETEGVPLRSLGLKARTKILDEIGEEPKVEDDRGLLMAEVPRWVDALRPRWIACEQVPPVLPMWKLMVPWLRERGYSAWAGKLSSERYGVPQTRERAILMASLDGAVSPPEPTHQAYRHGEPAQSEHGLFSDLKPWVSMAEALGWTDDLSLRQWRGEGMVERHGERPDREAGEPSFAVTGADHRTKLVVRSGQTVNGGPLAEREVDDPAFTVGSRADQWQLVGGAAAHATVRPAPAPAPTILGNVGKNGGWVWERPATTIAGDPRCFSPGGHIAHDGRNNDNMVGRSQDAIRLTLPEGLTLQGFPPDWPVQGTKTAQWLQVGNAIPPPLARAVLGQLVPAQEQTA